MYPVLSALYIDVIMAMMASQITSLSVVYSTVYSDADQRKHQSSASLAFVWGIHRDRLIPRTKGQLRRKCFHLMTSSRGFWFLSPIWSSPFWCYLVRAVTLFCLSFNVSKSHTTMMTSSNGNISRVTGPLCGEFAGHRWIPLTKASGGEFGCFHHEQTVE